MEEQKRVVRRDCTRGVVAMVTIQGVLLRVLGVAYPPSTWQDDEGTLLRLFQAAGGLQWYSWLIVQECRHCRHEREQWAAAEQMLQACAGLLARDGVGMLHHQ